MLNELIALGKLIVVNETNRNKLGWLFLAIRKHTFHRMKAGFQIILCRCEIYRQYPLGRFYVHWCRWRDHTFARLDFNHQSLESSSAVFVILLLDKIRVKIRLTFITKKQEPAFGRAHKVGFEDMCRNDHWDNREAYRAMLFNRSLWVLILRLKDYIENYHKYAKLSATSDDISENESMNITIILLRHHKCIKN